MRRALNLKKCCALGSEVRVRQGTPVRNLPCSDVCVRLWISYVGPETSNVLVSFSDLTNDRTLPRFPCTILCSQMQIGNCSRPWEYGVLITSKRAISSRAAISN